MRKETSRKKSGFRSICWAVLTLLLLLPAAPEHACGDGERSAPLTLHATDAPYALLGDVGDLVTLEYTLTNTGNLVMTVDAHELITGLGWEAPIVHYADDSQGLSYLNPDTSLRITLTTSITQEDIAAGRFERTFCVHGRVWDGYEAAELPDGLAPNARCRAESAAVIVPFAPGAQDETSETGNADAPVLQLSLLTPPAQDGYYHAGMEIYFSLTALNPSDRTIDSLDLYDTLVLGDMSYYTMVGLQPGACETFDYADWSYSYCITEEDAAAGTITNQAEGYCFWSEEDEYAQDPVYSNSITIDVR